MDMKNKLLNLKSDIAYGLFNTPINMPPLNLSELKLIREASVHFNSLKPQVIKVDSFRNYVVYRFERNPPKKRALVVHGWSSKSVYMIKFIEVLLKHDYEVYAVDLPAHGSSKGFQVSWNDSIKTVLDIQKIFGKFDFALGHSLGGTAMLGALSLSHYLSEFQSAFQAKKIALISAPTRMQTIVDKFSNYVNLTKAQREIFANKVKSVAQVELAVLDAKRLQTEHPSDTEFLCLHGTKDDIIPFDDSVHFSELNNVKHVPILDEGHVHILHNDIVLSEVSNFSKI